MTSKQKARRCWNTGEPARMMEFESPIALNDITSERILQMKGILVEPGKEPVVTTLPDTLQGMEALLQCPCEQKVLPRTPAVLVYAIYGKSLNRTYRGQPIYGTILCYGWRNNRFQPLNKDLQAEMLDRLKDTEVRV